MNKKTLKIFEIFLVIGVIIGSISAILLLYSCYQSIDELYKWVTNQ